MRNQRPALTYIALGVLLVLGIATGLVVQRLWILRAEVEQLADQLKLDAGPESTLLYDADNELVAAVFEQHRIGVGLDKMSPHIVNAVIATEDKRFFKHHGVDIRRIVKAAVENQRAGEIVQGGSTITQQLVRSILLNREKSYTRKIKEAFLARRLEERSSKDAILQAYLNRVYFGDGYYGIEAAALGYFGKPATDLDVAEAATLAGLIKGPSLYSPTKAPELARKRRDLVLSEMRAEGMLSDQEFQSAVTIPIQTLIARGDRSGVPDPRHTRGAEYFRDTVSRELIERFGADAVYTGGLRVYTTLDRRLQAIAEEVVASRLNRMPSRGGLHEPLQGALVAIEPGTGYVRAIVGGRDFHESPFNRAIDAKRQPGSAFKPFIFAMALESGFSPSTRLDGLDQPIETAEGPWLPGGEHEIESFRLRDALVVSSNHAAAHLLQTVGVRRTLDLVSRFGISSPMPNVPSVALGTGEMSLVELTSAYGVFANRGVWRMPTTIRRVVDRDGREIYRAPETERPVISEATAYLMTSMMADVVDRGTATTARAVGFRMRAAGKTGTSSDYTDAWFVGYTPRLVAGVWFGYDTPRTIMNRGFAAVVAVPAWARFMMGATSGASDEWFEMPGSLVKLNLCRISGLLATDRCHLPVIESAPYDSRNQDILTASATIVREGGVYEELRHITRMPEPCPLLHGAPDLMRSYVDPMWVPSPDPPSSFPEPPAAPAATVIIHQVATPPPPSMTEPTRTPVTTVPPSRVPYTVIPAATPAATDENPVVPGSQIQRTPTSPVPPPAPVIPGSDISTAPPPPPRPPGNRPPM